MTAFAETVRVRDARDRYLADNGLSAAGYTDKWARFKLGPLPVWIPNTAARKRALPLHDLHHVATEYATTYRGEAEIAAWELAGGCGDYHAARGLNTVAFGIGLLIAPRATYRAFMRGRRSRTLYTGVDPNELLDLSVGELRRELGLDGDLDAPTVRDTLWFAAWCAIVVALVALPVAVAATIWHALPV
jgi:hypothetical protein